MTNDPCDNIVTLADYIRWTNLPGGVIAHMSWAAPWSMTPRAIDWQRVNGGAEK